MVEKIPHKLVLKINGELLIPKEEEEVIDKN